MTTKTPKHLSNIPLSWKYDSSGGYDCMYAGYDILDKDGAILLTLDGKDFGQDPCTEQPVPEAEELAQWIVDCANASTANPSPKS
jgi:hypothetical protein